MSVLEGGGGTVPTPFASAESGRTAGVRCVLRTRRVAFGTLLSPTAGAGACVALLCAAGVAACGLSGVVSAWAAFAATLALLGALAAAAGAADGMAARRARH